MDRQQSFSPVRIKTLLQTRHVSVPNYKNPEETQLAMEEMEDKVVNLELPKSLRKGKRPSNISKKVVAENYESKMKNNTSVQNNKIENEVIKLLTGKPSRDTQKVKKNAATILREAARIINEEEKEIQRLNELVSGGMDFKRFEQLEEEMRAKEEAAELQEIQRKHLLGLISREEAILAKHKLQLANKTKRDQVDKEKKETEEILKQLTLKHNEKIKKIVEKTQQTQKNIAEQKRNILDKKQKEAQEVADMNKQLHEKFLLKQREELEEKIRIIKQIKELSSIKDIHENRFDPTETMNIGLLCEMSLNELQERLLLNKAYLKRKIEDKKKCITEQRTKQQQFLLDTQQFIIECREQRKKINSKKGKKLWDTRTTESQDIVDLREKLLTARQKRMQLES